MGEARFSGLEVVTRRNGLFLVLKQDKFSLFQPIVLSFLDPVNR